MNFHHFTAVEYLDTILWEGLRRGDVPLTPKNAVNAVWLTTDPRPEGHGLSDGHVLSDEERTKYSQLFGVTPPPGARFPNKRAVRITVKVRGGDTKLKYWPTWSRKRIAPAWADALIRASGGGPRQVQTWWLYFGVMPPEWFSAVVAC